MYYSRMRILKAYYLDASIDFRMSVIEEERVLRVVLDLSLTLRLSSHIIVISGLEIVIVFAQIVGNIATGGCHQQSGRRLQGCLKN